MKGFLAILLLHLCHGQRMEVIKSWSAVASTGSAAKLACKASIGIHRCIWRNDKEGMEFDSDTEFGRGDNEKVEIESGRSRTFCYLSIDRARREHAGEWQCELQAECIEELAEIGNKSECSGNSVNFLRRPSRATIRDEKAVRGRRESGIPEHGARRESGVPEQGARRESGIPEHGARRRRQARRRRPAQAQQNSCDNVDTRPVQLFVEDSDRIYVAGAQDKYYANIGSAVTLTARTNEEFDVCKISLGVGRRSQDVVEIRGDSRRDECGDLEGRRAGSVCASVTTDIPSCVLKIESLTQEMEGIWAFTIERTISGRGRPKLDSETAEIELVKIELPDEVVLRYGREEFRSGGRNNKVQLTAGEETIECVATGGSPTEEMSVELFLGENNVSSDGVSCRGGRDATCREFVVDATPDMDGKELVCVARMPGTDTRDGNKASLVVNGRQVAVTVEMEFAPVLAKIPCTGDINSVEICDESLEEGKDFDLVVEFDSKPKPSEVEWVVRANEFRKSERVKAGNKVRTYDASEIRPSRDRNSLNRYVASIRFQNIALEDMGRDTEHELVVTNDAATTTFLITFDTGSSCQQGPDESCCDTCRGRECDKCSEDCCCKTCRGSDCDDCRENCRERRDCCDTCKGRDCNRCDEDCSRGTDCCDTCRGRECDDCRQNCSSDSQQRDCCDTCRGRDCDRCDEDCCCYTCRGRDCDRCREDCSSNGASGSKAAIKPFLDSCLALGTSLLDSYEPNGNRRQTSSNSKREEEEFQDLIEDFFSKARCADQDRDISRSYTNDEGNRRQPFKRPEFSFSKFDPTNPSASIIKTKQDIGTTPYPLAQAIRAATQVVVEGKAAGNATTNVPNVTTITDTQTAGPSTKQLVEDKPPE